MPSFDQAPDTPRPFGFKVLWFAVRTSKPVAVLNGFEFGEASPTNWTSGLAAVHSYEAADDPWVFIAPAVSGWTLAASRWFPYPVAAGVHADIGRKFDLLFSRLMKRFDDVQFFGSHRVSDFVTWARAVNGTATRIFAYSDGEVLANIGEQTSEEARLGFADLTGLSLSAAQDEIVRIADKQDAEESKLIAGGLSSREARARIRQNARRPMPDEGDVVDLAALWSIDPTGLLDQDRSLDLGLAVRLPEDLKP
jgi:hypothetical protein